MFHPRAAKQVPVAYGIKKLQISCVVEDDKIGTDFLEESITGFEDYVRYEAVVKFFASYDCVFAAGSKCGHCGLQQDMSD